MTKRTQGPDTGMTPPAGSVVAARRVLGAAMRRAVPGMRGVTRDLLRGIVGATAVMLAFGAIGTVFAKHWWLFDLASHFRVHYVAAALAAALLALAVRRRVTAIAIVLLAAPHLLVLDTLVRAEAAADPGAASPSLRVSTINVFWRNPSAGRVVDYVRRIDPDILIVQEADDAWRSDLVRLGALFADAAPDGLDDAYGIVLFSRHPIVAVTRVTPTPGGPPYMVAEIAVDGQTVSVVALHPPNPVNARRSALRDRYLAEVAEAVRRLDGPVIVAGDFNSTAWSAAYRDFVGRTGLANTAHGRGWRPTWPVWPPGGIAIDHVLVNDRLAVRDVFRGPDVGSDHFPLTVDLALR